MSILALLSPGITTQLHPIVAKLTRSDSILIDLFLPKNQRALDGKLQFCKQQPDDVDTAAESALSSVISAPYSLLEAIEELKNLSLIKQEGRRLWAHLVVQEAMKYAAKGDLQECFNSAAALVYEAFPKQLHGDYFSPETRGTCQVYITHATHLSRQFANYRADGVNILKG